MRTDTASNGVARAVALVVCAFVASGGRARAQTGGDLPDTAFRATRGVFVPDATRAGEADATAVELNPGLLPLLGGGSVAIVGDVWRSGATMPGRGGALFLAAPVWGAGGVGVGIQGLGDNGGGAVSGHTKFQLAYGIGGRGFGFGVSWAHLLGGGVGGTDTFDLGLGWRPSSRAGIGLVIEDVARPRLPGAADPLPRRLVGELALRPLATDRIEAGAAVLHVGTDSWSRLGWRFHLAARPWGAWRIFGELERSPRRAGASPPLPASDSGIDWRATAGFSLDFDHGTLILAGRRAFTPAGVSGENWGASGVWRGSTERNAVAITTADVARVKLHGIDSDRAFLDLVLRLRALSNDPGVAAVLLQVDGVDFGLGRVEELRDVIGEIRRHGKPVIAYLAFSSTRDLYLASACDRIVMHPAAELIFSGLAGAVTFYKSAMDRLGVAVDLVRIAEFKGAMEPFVMPGQSGPVRQNKNELLDDVYGRILAAIATGRSAAVASSSGQRIGTARLEELVALGSFTPVEARAAGLIDAIRDNHEVEDYLREFLGRGSITIRDLDRAAVRPARWSRSRVAVILVDGTITDGPSRHFPFDLGGVAGADTLVEALDECRGDASVRAVVLRVNSPGGSAFSSDVLARAVSRLRAAGKPVITSMGDVAASGGYYIAAPTDMIFAEPSTTTGSIGIFGFKLDVSRLLALLSINVEVYQRGPHADQLLPFRPWTDDERTMAERKIRYLYDLFTATVAEGRKTHGFTPAGVDKVGRGHVWTGAQARALGLVDELGGVTAAIDKAAALGGVPTDTSLSPDLLVLPRTSATILQKLAGLADADSVPATNTAAHFPVLAQPLRSALRLAAPYLLGPGEGVEARLPFDLDVR